MLEAPSSALQRDRASFATFAEVCVTANYCKLALFCAVIVSAVLFGVGDKGAKAFPSNRQARHRAMRVVRA